MDHEMYENTSLTDDQLDMLARFMEITHNNDNALAIATLTSLDWDLQKAVELNLAADAIRERESDSMDISDGDPSFVTSSHNESAADSASDHSVEFLGEYPAECNTQSSNSNIRNGSGSNRSPDASSSSSSDSEMGTIRYNRGILRNNDEQFVEFSLDADVDVAETCHPSKNVDRLPLIPSGYTNTTEASQNFVTVFESRYGESHPSFYEGSLAEAAELAFNASIMERRPLAIYLHSDHAIANNVFAKNILCAQQVIALLNAQYVIWAWDMTENKSKVHQMAVEARISGFSDRINCSTNRYPLLLIVVKEKNDRRILTFAIGTSTVQEVMDDLLIGVSRNQQNKTDDKSAQRIKEERELIMKEQHREYLESLAQDKANKERKEREEREQREREEELKRIQEEKDRHASELAAALPEEPGPNEKNIVHIRFRFPDNQTFNRRFRSSEPLMNALIYVESKGYSLDEYNVWTSDLPRQNLVGTANGISTFKDCKWPLREQLTVSEK